jgi:hypothetical protein
MVFLVTLAARGIEQLSVVTDGRSRGNASRDSEHVPAGTSVESGTCCVEGHGPIEPATAERLLCTPNVQGVLVGRGGKVLILGRTKRFATRP